MIKVALIGVGPMAALHARAFARVDGMAIVSCASRTRSKAEQFAATHAITRARTVTETLAQPDADALLVVAPADVMADLAVTCAGCQLPMLLEKPVGLSSQEARVAAANISVPTMVGLNRRFYSIYRKAREVLGQAGGIRCVEVHLAENPAALAGRYPRRLLDNWHLANSIHLIDLYRLFCGEPAQVQTMNQVGELSDRSYHAMLGFPGGASGVYTAQWYAPSRWRLTLYGTDHSVQCQPAEKALHYTRERFEPFELTPDEDDVAAKPGLVGQARAFRDLVRTGMMHADAIDVGGYVKSVELAERLSNNSASVAGR